MEVFVDLDDEEIGYLANEVLAFLEERKIPIPQGYAALHVAIRHIEVKHTMGIEFLKIPVANERPL